MIQNRILKCILSLVFNLILSIFAFSCAPKKLSETVENTENNLNTTRAQNIIGGQDLSHNPKGTQKINYSIVAIMDTSDMGTSTICTGTFITKNIILTAAHCVSENPSDLMIKIGNSVFSDQKSMGLTALKIIRHVDYVPGKNDLAVIQISEQELNEKNILIQPVHLTKESNFLNNNNFILFGYGVNQVESSAQEPDANDELQGAGELRQIKISSKFISKKNNLFVIDQSLGAGACHGDSGGPAFILNQKNKYELIAVASGIKQSNGQIECTDQSVYTNLNGYRSWIYESIVKLNQQN